MKRDYLAYAIFFIAILATHSQAQAAIQFTRSVAVVASNNSGNANVAVGRRNTASVGSINLRQSTIRKSRLLNLSRNTNNSNVAIGIANVAATGSIIVRGSEVDDSILLNSSVNSGNSNVAIGSFNIASTGTITID